MVKAKRIRPTKEQAQELNRRLDAVIDAGHTNNLYCDCEVCQALAEQAELMGYRTDSTIKQPSEKWDRRKQEYERRRQIDLVKVANLAGQGLTSAEISEKMHRSKGYINRIAKEFDIKIFTKKER
jgi:ribosomal protein L17